MKKVVLLLVGVVVLSISGLNAKNLPAVAAKLPADLKEVITQQIDYPNFADENQIEGEVWMKVTVNEDSKLRIVDLSATQPQLGKHVENELANLTIKNSGVTAGQVYFLKVAFEIDNK